MKGWKLVIDAEERKYEVSDLTADEACALAATRRNLLASLRRRWEESGDLEALYGGLVFLQPQVPGWMVRGLWQSFEQQRRNPHAIRFLAVRYAHNCLGMTMLEAYDWATEHVTDPIAKGRPDSMMKSAQKMQRKVARLDRIQPRPRRPRRPRS